MTTDDYITQQKLLAAAWKRRTSTLVPVARRPAPWINQAGDEIGVYDHCLPRDLADGNLLPDSHGAIELFRELSIPWHCGIDGGPGNNLLSSQVQCVNALMPMVDDPERLRRAFGGVVDIAEVLEIEPGRHVTFEYVDRSDHFGEGNGRPLIRGSKCTSVDAAFLYRTSTGTTEMALVEWKYTESYPRKRKPAPGYDATRKRRYGPDYHAPDGPLRSEMLDIDWMLDEPFYQLMRQQLLAWHLEQSHAEGADVVRVLHVLPPGNRAYQRSLVRPEHRALGDSVDEIWSRLLRRPDRFRHVDPSVFLDEEITSLEYVDRYSPLGAGVLPWGVSVWRRSGRVIAAAYAYAGGFELCHTCAFEPPGDLAGLAALPDREHFPVADDEKTLLVGPLEWAAAFIRAVVSTGLSGPEELTSSSWPEGGSRTQVAWGPVDVLSRIGP